MQTATEGFPPATAKQFDGWFISRRPKAAPHTLALTQSQYHLEKQQEAGFHE